MSVIETMIRIIAPHTCLGCGAEEDRLLCAVCVDLLPAPPMRCYRCRATTADTVVCNTCEAHTPLGRVRAYTSYRGAAKQLVHRLKFERARSAASEIGPLLAGCIDPAAPALIVAVPTATARVRARGYDHAALIARALSQATGLPMRRLLARHGQARQVGADRHVRREQLRQAFRVRRPTDVQGRHIILVDDVLTTGATLETAAHVLLAAGAARVDAVTFAQA